MLKSLYLEMTHGKNGLPELEAVPEDASVCDYRQADVEVSFLLNRVLPLGLAMEKRRAEDKEGPR